MVVSIPIMQYNELRDMTNLLSEVCCGVGIEPSLQPLANETLRYRTANREEGAQLDIVAEPFGVTDNAHYFSCKGVQPTCT